MSKKKVMAFVNIPCYAWLDYDDMVGYDREQLKEVVVDAFDSESEQPMITVLGTERDLQKLKDFHVANSHTAFDSLENYCPYGIEPDGYENASVLEIVRPAVIIDEKTKNIVPDSYVVNGRKYVLSD